MNDEFVKAVLAHQGKFGLDLSVDVVERLSDYYGLVLEHNSLLHLVGPCSPEEFARRHILESLMLLKHLPEAARFADVGAGAGLPSIPCLLVRDDLNATLIESKVKKTRFLDKAVKNLGLSDRASIVNRQFEETTPGDSLFVTCRALDKFTERLPRIVRWSDQRTLILFGGISLGDNLELLGLRPKRELLPLSEQRFLYKASS